MLAKRLDSMGLHVIAGCFTETGINELRETGSERLVAMTLDVTSETSIANAVEQVNKILPRNKGLWAIVNNAGIVGGTGPTSWQTRKDYNDTLAVNLYGVIFMTKAFLPLVLLENGRVVNMSSVMARFPLAGAAYTVSKYGVDGFSRILRRELYLSRASVHVIEPGFFDTPLMNSATLKRRLQEKIDSLPIQLKRQIPEQTLKAMFGIVGKLKSRLASKDLYKVVDAYTHAIIARFPKERYLVGIDANILFRFLWNLPEWLSDFIVLRILLR